MFTYICQNLSTEHFDAGDVIMTEGDNSNNKMYLY